MATIVISSCQPKKEQVPPLIGREVFFDDPEISGARLSPDGSYISFLRPYQGTRNIWVKALDADFDSAIPVTAETARPITSYFWSRDGKYLLYVMDKGGDENFNIFALNPKDASEGVIPEARNITKLAGVRAQIIHVSRNDHDLMFVGLNNRDRAWHDLYSLRISTGELKLIRENNNRYTSWIFDNDDNLRMASLSRIDGTNELYRMDEGGETLIYSWTVLQTAYPIQFQADNTHFYLASNVSEDVNFLQLYLMNVETGEKEFVEKDPENRADFGYMVISDKTLDVLFTAYTFERTQRYFKNKEFENHFNRVKKELGDVEISFFSPTSDEAFWLVSASSDVNPGTVYLYDTQKGELTFQYHLRPDLPSEHLSPMTSIIYPSSDGLEIQAYLVLPKGFDNKNLPLVVFPHGGPWARDYWGFDRYAQFLANRGYAVLLPNFRGSTGFGSEFLNAGNQQWGKLMQDDKTWGVKYLIDKGIADPERVAIFGISYGGYAALAGLAFTPEVYAAGVSFVGPSNLITLLNSIPPYWEGFRLELHARMADPSTEEGRQWLKKASPLNSADRISAPLLVVQGQNDPRVLKAESDQIVVALRDRGFPVEYLNADDEGHGFARPVNNMAFVAAMERFLAEYVGGRFQETKTEEVAKRLAEITVDVSTVELN